MARVIQRFLEGRMAISQFYAFVWDDSYENSAAKNDSIPTLASRVRGKFGALFRGNSRHWNVKTESRSGAFHGVKIHGAVVPLQNLIRLGQADSAAFFFGGEVQLENLVSHVFGNSTALVLHFRDNRVAFAAR